LKEELVQAGAIYAAMSGSGSSVFGIFKEKITVSESLKNNLVFEGFFD
jgi:4-diphosphocytidyl-2-C-methyl-D-erythritol kinase